MKQRNLTASGRAKSTSRGSGLSRKFGMALRRAGALAALMACTAAPALSATLWEQSATGSGLTSQDFPDLGGVVQVLNDVVFGQAVTINKVSVPFSVDAGTVVPTVAHLDIFSGPTLDSADVPGIGLDYGIASAPVNVIQNSSVDWVIEVTGLNISLAAGTYWIGLAPVAPFSGGSNRFFAKRSVTPVGAVAQLRDQQNLFGAGITEWTDITLFSSSQPEIGLKVEDASPSLTPVPAPAGLPLLLAGAGVLAFLRARKP